MATLVCFHAHPDDETTATGGTIARAKADGHRVVLVVATNGDHGERPDDLGPDETLPDRRRAETQRSARVLGIDRVAWLGFKDSGMTGWPENEDPASFLQAPLEEAAERLAAILREERPAALTVYDWHGLYGHPDHIKVHTVGHRAAELAGTEAVFEATMNRDHFTRLRVDRGAEGAGGAEGAEGGAEDFDPNGPADDGNPFGMPEADITHEVDVSAYIELKRAALRCHASQATDIAFFTSMTDDAFRAAFGKEWYIRPGAPTGDLAGWLFE